MTKTLLSAAFLMLLLATPALAQEDGIRDTSVPPDQQADGGGGGWAMGLGAGATTTSQSSVFLSGAPINLRPGAYIARDSNAAPNTTDSVAFIEPKKTSAAAYNATLLQNRAVLNNVNTSPIPSPFPPGFGE